MNYKLVLQWPASAIDDYDSLVAMEDVLIDKFTADSEVDGHDAGAGEMNIFINTNSPKKDFLFAREALIAAGFFAPARAAFRKQEEDSYEILWPVGSKDFSIG